MKSKLYRYRDKFPHFDCECKICEAIRYSLLKNRAERQVYVPEFADSKVLNALWDKRAG